MLQELVNEGEIGNDWEVDFIASVVERFEKGYNFSDRQLDKIDEIHGRYY